MVKVTVDIEHPLQSVRDFEANMLPYVQRSTLTRTARSIQQILKRDIRARYPGRGGMRWILEGGGDSKGLTFDAATKAHPYAYIYLDAAQSHIMWLHEFGGVKTPYGKSKKLATPHFAVPMPELIKPGKRIAPNMQPKWLLQGYGSGYAGGTGPLAQVFKMYGTRMARRAAGKRVRTRTPKYMQTFNTGFIVKGANDRLFIAIRPKGASRLKYLYWLAPSTHVEKALNFVETAASVAPVWLQYNFNLSMRHIKARWDARQKGAVETATAYE